MKVIAIGGEPATGKTKLVKEVMSKYSFYHHSYKKKLLYDKNRELNLIVLGSYVEHKFDGTDRLHMGVQPDAEKFIQLKSESVNVPVILFEGDRLFNIKFFDSMPNSVKLYIIMLVATDKVLRGRHVRREDTQSQQFLKGRKTKIQNIYQRYGNSITVWKNEDREDFKTNAKHLIRLIKAGEGDLRLPSLGSLNVNKSILRGILG